jgi:hypothetical protein
LTNEPRRTSNAAARGSGRASPERLRQCLDAALHAKAVRPWTVGSYLLSCNLDDRDDVSNTLECLQRNQPHLFNKNVQDPGVTLPPPAVALDRVDPEFLGQLLRRYDGERSASASRPRS